MSAPRCLRTALETCRPCKNTPFLAPARLVHSQKYRTRNLSSSVPRCSPSEDITAGFPMPEVGSRKIQGIDDGQSSLETGGDKETERAADTSKLSPSPASEVHTSRQKISVRASSVANTDPSRAPAALSSTKGKAPVSVTAQQPSEQDPNDLDPATVNVPPNVLAAFRTPLRHKPTHGIPVASLQMRSYSVRNLEFYADFAVRAAYWLGLPCSGPVPLPKKIERWTVPRSPFIFKKSMENFERITRRRLLTIYDGDPTVVEIWLAFLRKWQFYGVGMKANVWQFESLDVAGNMDKQFADLEKELDEKLRLFGFSKAAAGNRNLVQMMHKQGVRGPGVGVTDVRDGTRDPKEQTFFT